MIILVLILCAVVSGLAGCDRAPEPSPAQRRLTESYLQEYDRQMHEPVPEGSSRAGSQGGQN